MDESHRLVSLSQNIFKEDNSSLFRGIDDRDKNPKYCQLYSLIKLHLSSHKCGFPYELMFSFYCRDPSVKRTICKKCFSLLIPGVTATTRQQRKKRKTRFTVVTCLSCGQSKKFLNNPDYCLWVDNPKAQMDQQKPPDSGHSAQHQTKKDKKADGSQASKSSATQSKDGT
ncbi:ribonuclease P protein subunit p21 isoform X1 [Pleuronectes platessa]|uniref:ribonuclease P protein subunit p21 isoform X1 n=1 Tax=Pleuronectes platessa TaxID=8262 RepID=UPI00232A1471|nr:ribonuclease P protein subunit p21 isoform X1 [Pleuronectes platessa]